jgi:hypothetical protein
MARSLRLAIAFGLLAALVVGTGTVAAHRDGPHKILDTRLVGLATPGTVVVGVTGAGHAWAIDRGNAKLYDNGRVKVDVRGLVLTPEGTNPVANGRVVVSCNGGGAGNVIQSGLVPLSVPGGNAHFDGKLTLPSPCLAPVIFFTSGGGAWFAVSG